MWRLWTRGWGVRSWVWWVKDATPRKIAFWLPRKVALWAFIRVYSACEQDPGPEYTRAYKYWEHPCNCTDCRKAGGR